MGYDYVVFFVCVLGVWLEGWLRMYCEWCAYLRGCVFGVGAVVVCPLCRFRFLLFEWLDVWFGYRVWSVRGMVWVMGLSFLLAVWFVLCRGKQLLLGDVFWDCFPGAQGLVDLWIAMVCCGYPSV